MGLSLIPLGIFYLMLAYFLIVNGATFHLVYLVVSLVLAVILVFSGEKK